MNIGEIIKARRKALGLTLEEIGKRVGVSKGTVLKWEDGRIENMRRDKIALLATALHLNPMTFVTGKVTEMHAEPAIDAVRIPVLGDVRAGIPMAAIQNILDYEEISKKMASQGEFFGLKIKGSSMEPKFSEGDVVIIRKQEDVDSGDIAIVLVNGEDATIKKIHKFEGGIALVPSNPAYEIHTFTDEQILSLPVTILGKVVELRAKF